MNGERIQIVLVDRGPEFAGLIARALEKDAQENIQITHHTSLPAAKSLLGRSQVDAVVIDLASEDGFTLEAISELLRQAPELPIVALIPPKNAELGLQALRRGAQDCLVKTRVTTPLLSRSVRFAIERQQLRAMLRRLAMVDEQTGLYNQHGFQTLARQQLRLARRRHSSLALLLLDARQALDEVEDAPAAGQVHSLAGVLRRTFRASDILARYYPAVFTVLAIDVPPNQLERVASRLRENLAITAARGELPEALSGRVLARHLPGSGQPAAEELPSLIAGLLAGGR